MISIPVSPILVIVMIKFYPGRAKNTKQKQKWKQKNMKKISKVMVQRRIANDPKVNKL